MKRLIWIMTLAALVALAGSASAEPETFLCSPEGVWYGFSSEGYDAYATVDRVGFGRYTAVFDFGASFLGAPVLSHGDYRGEIWREGRRSWRWRSFAYFALDPTDPASFGFEYLLVDCVGSLDWDGCDAFTSDDLVCDWKGFMHGWDPFADGILINQNLISVSYQRMPRP